MKKQLLIIGIICLICLLVFSIMIFNGDSDYIVIRYNEVANRDIVRHRKEEVLARDTASSSSSSSSTATTFSDSSTSWRERVLAEAEDTYNKGCIYHQLRQEFGTTDRCYSGDDCDGEKNKGFDTYDFETQANYTLEDPLYLDCSFFVKHCYYIAGVPVTANTAEEFYNSEEFTTIKLDAVQPGDIMVKRKHIRIIISKTENNVLHCIHMSSHKNDCQYMDVNANDVSEYIYRTYKGG